MSTYFPHNDYSFRKYAVRKKKECKIANALINSSTNQNINMCLQKDT